MNPLVFSEKNIQLLFGNEAAEDERLERLKEYYFKNEIFNRVVTDLSLRVLVGHKGIGKSALFKIAIAEDKDNGKLPILIKPDDIGELGKYSTDFLQIIRDWKQGLNKIISQKVLNTVGIKTNNPESLVDKLTQYGGRTIAFLTETFEIAEKNIRLGEAQKILIRNFLKNRQINVYIDDLDRGWMSRIEDITRISALLNTVRDMSNENPGLNFKISLRSDVYYLVRTSDESTDKIEGSVIWYNWSNHEILVMLIKRIETFFGNQIDETSLLKNRPAAISHYLDRVMDKRFQGFGKWENAPMYRILMSLIRKRPRDLVKLCTLAAREAYKDKSPLIKTEHLQGIFEEYSQGRIQDAVNEYKSELPSIERLLFGMKPSRKEKKAEFSYVYTTPELLSKIHSIIEQGQFTFTNGKIASAKELAQFLYKINFLTARKVITDQGIHRKYFEENRYLSNTFVDFGYDWEVHPAFRWSLQPDQIEDIFKHLELSGDFK